MSCERGRGSRRQDGSKVRLQNISNIMVCSKPQFQRSEDNMHPIEGDRWIHKQQWVCTHEWQFIATQRICTSQSMCFQSREGSPSDKSSSRLPWNGESVCCHLPRLWMSEAVGLPTERTVGFVEEQSLAAKANVLLLHRKG